ncbi:MAG: hypothetical protein DRJ03_03420 [Chloroflexi bacterium]|nr:MAG: hypothetical protein DRJ03_03420 [Chloroflexota bacterium]
MEKQVLSDKRIRFELENHPLAEDHLDWRGHHNVVIGMFKERVQMLIQRRRYFSMWLVANVVRWDYFWEYDEEFKIRRDVKIT